VPDSTSHITTSGGLLTEAFIDSMRTPTTDRPHTGPGSFEVPWAEMPSTTHALEDQIAAAWELLQERWDSIRQETDHLNDLDTSDTRQRWLLPLLQLLDFAPESPRAPLPPTRSPSLRFPVSPPWSSSTRQPAPPASRWARTCAHRWSTPSSTWATASCRTIPT